MKTRPLWISMGVVALVVAGVPDRVHAQLDPVAEFQGLLDFVCGPDPDRCFDRQPPLSDEDIAVLGAELARLLAVARSEVPDPADESNRFEAELLRRCDRDAAQCWVWIQKLARSGPFDADLDGVFDDVDRCLGSDTNAVRARSILLAQQRALAEVRELLIAVRLLVIQGTNGTLGSAERQAFARTAETYFFELVSIANERVDGRPLFAGEREDRLPFDVSGVFDDVASPTVSYRGSRRPGSLPVGRSGESVPITIPGSRLFLADIDGDGRFPDEPGVDLFSVVVDVRDALRSQEPEPLYSVLAVVDDAIGGQIAEEQRRNGDAFAGLRRSFPRRELANVDPAGCSREQFCDAIPIGRPSDLRVCEASDHLNDEPLTSRPRDCRVRRAAARGFRCEAARAAPR